VEDLRDALKDIETVAVIDRAFTYGYEGPVFIEIKSALYTLDKRPHLCNFIVGLGGRDTLVKDVFDLVNRAKESSEGEVIWFNLKA
jgi:pyruvate/2-oxoacid:ferredoxin oxidoreductase alpha subunit